MELRTIIDGGANKGQFTRAAAELYPDATIYVIEALPELAVELRSVLRDLPKVEIMEYALGQTDGITEFHRNSYSHASSALPITSRHRIEFPESKETDEITVEMRTLDTLFAGKRLSGPTLLKLDLQGFEGQAILGATELLQQVDYVLIEMSFEEMYEGQASFDEMNQLLRSMNFVFDFPIDFLSGKSGGIIQMDSVYVRKR